MSRGILQPHLGIAIGILSILAGMTFYVSPDGSILGRWSPSYAVALVSALLACVGVLLRGLSQHEQGRTSRRGDSLLGFGVALIGLAYLLESASDPTQASRIFDGNVSGSTAWVTAMSSWTGACLMTSWLGVWAWDRMDASRRNLLLVPLSAAAALLALEGVARVKALAAPSTQGFPTYSERVWFRRFVEFNDMGFRDRPRAVHETRADARKILIVGDSYALGAGIPHVEDRLGERLARAIAASTGEAWESMSAARGNTHSLDHLKFLEQTLPLGPDLVLLLYVFNDIDYLVPVTQRSALTNPPGSLQARLHPGRIAFQNSFLFQEVYVRLRAMSYRHGRSSRAHSDPYRNPEVLGAHLSDLSAFVALSIWSGVPAHVVPFDLAVVADARARDRYRTFVAAARSEGLPLCDLEDAFDGHRFEQLTVNRLDTHPNEVANRLASSRVLRCVLAELEPTPGP